MITVILNCYRRPQYLKEQIAAIKSQTIKPEEIIIWYNNPENGQQYNVSGLGAKVILCDHNFKFHGRFAAALLAKTKYVALVLGGHTFMTCYNFKNPFQPTPFSAERIDIEAVAQISGIKYVFQGTFDPSARAVDIILG